MADTSTVQNVPATISLQAFQKTLYKKMVLADGRSITAPTEDAIYSKLLGIRFPRRRMSLEDWQAALKKLANEPAYVDHTPKPVTNAPRVTARRSVPRR